MVTKNSWLFDFRRYAILSEWRLSVRLFALIKPVHCSPHLFDLDTLEIVTVRLFLDSWVAMWLLFTFKWVNALVLSSHISPRLWVSRRKPVKACPETSITRNSHSVPFALVRWVIEVIEHEIQVRLFQILKMLFHILLFVNVKLDFLPWMWF